MTSKFGTAALLLGAFALTGCDSPEPTQTLHPSLECPMMYGGRWDSETKTCDTSRVTPEKRAHKAKVRAMGECRAAGGTPIGNPKGELIECEGPVDTGGMIMDSLNQNLRKIEICAAGGSCL